MALKRDSYKALEDVVGPENISEDLAILEGYTYQPMGEGIFSGRFGNRPEAVVLPDGVKEVQAIIKLCNRLDIKAKAFCTGYGAHTTAGSPGTILLDLRRMNRILDFDEKNMFMLVEPYVSFAQVQAEAMKRGLNINVIGAGSQTSVLASFTSMHGNNILAISQSTSGRNMLGVEWVLPTGEIVKLGAAGSNAGWFSGDGPGPSLRGIVRGAEGALGGLGVFTKCAAHLHPWPGPSEMEVNEISPDYDAELPLYFEYHICEFPTYEQYGEAIAKIGAAGIGYALHKTGGPGTHGGCVTGSNNEYYEKRETGQYAIPWKSFSLVMAAAGPEEHAFQVKTLAAILDETGGVISPIGEDPLFKKRDFLTMIKSCFIPRLAFRPTGIFCVDGIVGMETVEHAAYVLKTDETHRNEYAQKGVIMDDGTINSWGVSFEGSHFALTECGHPFGSLNQDSINGMMEMMMKGRDICTKNSFAISWSLMGDMDMQNIAPLCFNYQNWMKKIKKTFDPNIVSDPKMYVTPDKE